MVEVATPRVETRAAGARVLDIVRELVGEVRGPAAAAAVAPDQSLERDLGIGSLERVELLLRLERAFDVRLPEAAMTSAETPRDLVRAVLGAGPALREAAPEAEAPLAAGAPPPETARTLVEVLGAHAEATPDRTHVLLVGEDGVERPISYGALWTRARAVAGGLAARGVEPGETVALMLRTEEAFFPAFFGVLLAGAVPVPLYPPWRADRIEEFARRQRGILDNARASVLVTFAEAERVGTLLAALAGTLREVTSVDRLVRGAAAPPAQRPGAADPALVQYTSGSTGDPKGVLLSHANVLANLRAIGQALAVGPGDVAVSWLPLYHDMGLIGAWLGALYFGVPTVILSPLAFLARPARWLRTIAAHRATISPAPNFAFDLCVAKIRDDELTGVDLASWRLALNGSEPVSAETIARFTRRFARWGFRPEAMCPVYGLAEAAVGLTLTPPGRGARVDRIARETFAHRRRAEPAAPDDPAALAVVACGRPLPDHEVRVVDAGGRPVPERVEGRIEFRGPSVTRGYLRNPEATRAAWRDGWLDSGDLGYWADGDLFVTGRRKDLVIKAGRNLHPQEVEAVAGEVPGVRRGCVAAFGVADATLGTERLVVVAETRETAAAARARLAAAVQQRVVDAIGLPPDTIVLVGPGAVLKTPSGKTRRTAIRDAYLAGRLGARASARRQWLRLARAGVAARLARLPARLRALAHGVRVIALMGVGFPVLWVLVAAAGHGPTVDRIARRWCRAMLRLAGITLRVEGFEPLTPGRALVFAANHASYLDVPALLAAVPADFRFVAKRELLATPLIGRIIRTVGHLTVERVDLAQSVADAEAASRALRAGVSLFVFPEGTFRRSPGLLPFKLGGFKAAVEAGCPVVPVALVGTREALPADARLPRRGTIVVRIGRPLSPQGTGWQEMVRLRDLTRAAIEAALGEGPQ